MRRQRALQRLVVDILAEGPLAGVAHVIKRRPGVKPASERFSKSFRVGCRGQWAEAPANRFSSCSSTYRPVARAFAMASSGRPEITSQIASGGGRLSTGQTGHGGSTAPPGTGTGGRHEGKPVRLQRQGDSLHGNQRSLPPLPLSM
jgi:hypothetical protein